MKEIPAKDIIIENKMRWNENIKEIAKRMKIRHKKAIPSSVNQVPVT